MPTTRPWTPEEDAILAQAPPVLDRETLARLCAQLGRTARSVQSRRTRTNAVRAEPEPKEVMEEEVAAVEKLRAQNRVLMEKELVGITAAENDLAVRRQRHAAFMRKDEGFERMLKAV